MKQIHPARFAIGFPSHGFQCDERKLLNALLTDAELRVEIVGALRTLKTIDTLPSRRIFQAIFAVEESGGRVGFDEINGRLEAEDQNLLAQTVLNEDAEVDRDEIVASVVSMQRSEQQNLRGELKLRINEAERAGRVEEALRLMTELQGLERAGRGGRQLPFDG